MNNAENFLKKLIEFDGDDSDPMTVLNLADALCAVYGAVTSEETFADRSEVLYVFREIWDWYCAGTGCGTEDYYNKTEVSDAKKFDGIIKKYGGEKTAEMFAAGFEDGFSGFADIDRYITDNEPELLSLLRLLLVDNSQEVETAMEDVSGHFTTQVDTQKFEKLFERHPEAEEFARNVGAKARENMLALLNSDCAGCSNRLENNSMNELTCKAFPEGVPEETILSKASQNEECANGYRYSK